MILEPNMIEFLKGIFEIIKTEFIERRIFCGVCDTELSSKNAQIVVRGEESCTNGGDSVFVLLGGSELML